MSKSVDSVNHLRRTPASKASTRPAAPAAAPPAAAATPAPETGADTDASSPDGDAVFDAIHELMHLYRAPRQRAAQAATVALTHMEHKVLGFFCRHPGATQSALATHAGRDKGQLARLIAGLRARGLIEARPDPDDRRNLRLHPTPEAIALQQAAQQQARGVAAEAVQGLDADERRQLLALLARIRENLQRAA